MIIPSKINEGVYFKARKDGVSYAPAADDYFNIRQFLFEYVNEGWRMFEAAPLLYAMCEQLLRKRFLSPIVPDKIKLNKAEACALMSVLDTMGETYLAAELKQQLGL